MLLAVSLLYATGLMPPADQNWEQTQLVGFGALFWFIFSFTLQIAGWWKPTVEGVRRLEADPVNSTDELFPLLLKLVLVFAAILWLSLMGVSMWVFVGFLEKRIISWKHL